ncbi:MAG: sulfotransferase family protein [Chitinophagales bacterium]
MSLKIIGAGWGRTGTESLKIALEHLGFGKCYHMFELMKDSTRAKYWLQLEKGEQPDYDALFKDYQSAVDFPAALYYREFMKQYPDAKVILTVRDADKWYDSASKTILKGIPAGVIFFAKVFGIFSKNLRALPKAQKWLDRILFKETGLFQNQSKNREAMKAIFNKWNEEVQQTVPADKLLVFEVKEGWEPLCKFLNVAVPEIPFPKSNDSESFRKRARKGIMRRDV